MLFFIRFRGQLRRTKPGVIASLEETIAQAASAAGGSAEFGRKLLTASFDEDRIGFWLDMLISLEKMHRALAEAANELYGCTLVLGKDIPQASDEASAQKLCRSLTEGNGGFRAGIWCSGEVRKALAPYLIFGSQDEYAEIREWKNFGAIGAWCSLD